MAAVATSFSGFTLVDFTVPTRESPMTHPVAEAPIHRQSYGKEVDAAFFDPNCPEGQEILQDPKTTIPQLFAIMRQWVPQIQKNMNVLTNEVLRRGAHVEDRDSLTDHTLLHYACKSAACGVGDEEAAVALVNSLIGKGADVSSQCKWTSMAPLHYAAFFNSAKLIKAIVAANGSQEIGDQCEEFDKGTALHIAAEGLCRDAVECLISLGADASLKNDHQQLPWQCIPSDFTSEKQEEIANHLMTLLKNAAKQSEQKKEKKEVEAAAFLMRRDLKLGDRVLVSGTKYGFLQFCGETKFAPGFWVGVELEEAVGKNDGSIGGQYYFKCNKNHGLFAPLSKISKASTKEGTTLTSSSPRSSAQSSPVKSRPLSSGVVGMRSRVGLHELDGGVEKQRASTINSNSNSELKVGDRVLVGATKLGTLRFVGKTKFAPGVWFGIELDQAIGKNNGSIGSERYFTCEPKHGVFAPPAKVCRAQEASSPSAKRSVRPRTAASTKSNPPPPLPLSSSSSSSSGPPIPGGLSEGTTVLVNGEIGTLRFVGKTEFSEGSWLGIELRKPSGKNDGSVKGKRYFSCKPDHGILVRPSRVTVRGINAAKLLADEQQPPS